MGARSKSGNSRGAARKGAARAPGRRGRKAANAGEAWEQTAQVPEERDGEFDCERIVQGEAGRSLPPYFDEYN